jgi:hypothetical protein
MTKITSSQAPFFSSAESPSIRSLIFYDDFATGISGKILAELVAEELGPDCRSITTLWRLDVLDSPAIEDQVSADAVAANLLIFSVRGDTDLPHFLEDWLQTHARALPGAQRHIVLLSDESIRDPAVCTAILEQLENFCAETNSTVSAYVVNVSANRGTMSFQADMPHSRRAEIFQN